MAICGSTKPVSLAELLQLSKITATAFSTCTSAEELSTTAYEQGRGAGGFVFNHIHHVPYTIGLSGIAASQCASKSWCTMLGMIVVISARWRADAMTMQSPLCTPAVTAGMTALADSHAGLEPHRWAGGTAVRSCQTEVMTWRCDDDNWDLMLTEAAAKTTAGTSPRGHAEPTLVE